MNILIRGDSMGVGGEDNGMNTTKILSIIKLKRTWEMTQQIKPCLKYKNKV